jgi:transcriptional regulator with XRE-family HTH domain
MPRKNHFSEEIRDAINASGKTHYKICQEIGLVQSAMSKFMTGRAGLSLAVIDRIAEVLDLHVVAHKPDRQAPQPRAVPKKKA